MIKNYLNLKKFKNKVNFGFFTSKGGVSKGDYYSLNCSKANNDKKKNVSKNIKIALKQLGINNKKLKLINQTHSNKIYFINKKNFKNDFDILSVLRNIKIIGIFTRLSLRDKKYYYLKLIPNAWKLIEYRVNNNAVFKDLKLLLDKNFSKKIRQ
mgnify:CR=1 FL=1